MDVLVERYQRKKYVNQEMHPFTSAEAANPEFSYLIRKSGNAYTFAAD